jgi:hypothetical protein
MTAGPEKAAALLAQLSDDEVSSLEEMLPALIEHRTGRIEYAESRRTSFAVFGGVLLAAGVAGLVQLAKGGYPYFPTFLGLVCFCGALIVLGGLVLALYARQTNWAYPFKEGTSTWKWFYRDGVPETAEAREPWHLLPSESRHERGVKAVEEGSTPFYKRTLTLADSRIAAAQDLEQLYVLHWNDFYKNLFLTHLRKVVIWGLLSALGVGLLGLVVGLCVHCG